jgi:hypothetical protein
VNELELSENWKSWKSQMLLIAMWITRLGREWIVRRWEKGESCGQDRPLHALAARP